MSGLSSGFDVGTKGYGGIAGRTAIMAIVGGTASALGGGKFSNGAVSGATVHFFNGEGHGKSRNYKSKNQLFNDAKDGHLTLKEANNWYRHGEGKTLIVDGSKINFTINTAKSTGIYTVKPNNIDDFLVHGTMTINAVNSRIYDGMYDFDIQEGRFIRNILTYGGKYVAGSGQKFMIEYRYNGEWRNQ